MVIDSGICDNYVSKSTICDNYDPLKLQAEKHYHLTAFMGLVEVFQRYLSLAAFLSSFSADRCYYDHVR